VREHAPDEDDRDGERRAGGAGGLEVARTKTPEVGRDGASESFRARSYRHRPP
jgi:hypothetical protein